MATLEDELRGIQTQISQVQAKKARAQVETDNAKASRDRAKQVLKDEFGVETNEEAKAMLVELESKLAAAVSDVQKALAASGA